MKWRGGGALQAEGRASDGVRVFLSGARHPTRRTVFIEVGVKRRRLIMLRVGTTGVWNLPC